MGKTIEEHFARQARKEEVLESMRENDWKGVLEHFNRPNDNYHEPLLVWIRPSMAALTFLEVELKRQKIDKILSIGCGCGFLEWLITKACSPSITQVHGLEVNSTWWESTYSTPHYIPLEYMLPVSSASPTNECIFQDSSSENQKHMSMEIPLHQGKNKIPEKFADRCRDKSMALLFNYFNQIQYFKEYLESYEGNCIILIGPVDGKRSCDPEPLYLHQFAEEQLRCQWKLVASHDIRGEKEDLIAIYIRR